MAGLRILAALRLTFTVPVAIALLAVPGEVTLAGGSASAAGAFDTPNYQAALYGDFHVVGGSVGDGPTPGSSQAQLQIPAGATVRYAQLNWGGHSGKFLDRDEWRCADPQLAAEAYDQRVTLALGSAPGTAVPLDQEHYRTSRTADEPAEMYSNWADVTAELASATTGTDLTVTVGDVWTPSCTGGWSMIVVFGYDQPQSGYPLRAVDVYTDHYRKPGTENDAISFAGLNTRSYEANVRLGVTAFAGADFSVDVKTLRAEPESTETNVVTMQLPAAADSYLLQSVVFSEDISPGLSITNSANVHVASEGETVRFTKTISNTGIDTIMPNVVLSDELPAGCAGDIGALLPGESVTVVCELVAGSIGLGSEAVVRSSYGGDDLASAIAPAFFRVAHMTVSQQPPTAPVRAGENTPFTFTVTNDGEARLFNVTVINSALPGCRPQLAHLAAGESRELSCTVPAPTSTFTNTATAQAFYYHLLLLPHRHRLTATAEPITVRVINPKVEFTQTAEPAVAHEGETVTFNTTVKNTGNTDLRDVSIAFDQTAPCNERFATLKPGESQTFRCDVTAGAVGFTNTATLTAVDESGQQFTVTASASFTVIKPALSLTQSAEPATAPAGSEVTITFTATNQGSPTDGALTDITVTNPPIPDCQPAPIPELAPGASATTSCTFRATETVESKPTASGTDGAGETVTATAEPLTITVTEPKLVITHEADPATVRLGGQTTISYTVTNSGEEADGPITDITITDEAISGCTPEPIEQLDPGDSETRTCTTTPEQPIESTPTAAGTDQDGEDITAIAEPLTIEVIDPKLEIMVAAEPPRMEPGEEVRFTVTVRNIGDVALQIEVTNDEARDCDFTVTADGLTSNAAQSQKCTTRAPSSLGQFVNTAKFTATPTGVKEPGEPLTGEGMGSVEVVQDDGADGPDTPPPTAPPDEGTGGGGGDDGGGGGGGTGGGGGDTDGGSGQPQGGLAMTGASVGLALVLALSTIALGILLTGVAHLTQRRRQRHSG